MLKHPPGDRLGRPTKYPSPEIRRYTGDHAGLIGDDNSGAGLNAKLKVRVNTTDTYIVQTQYRPSYVDSNPGTYTLVVTRR